LAHLVAHLLHPTGDALRVVLVQIAQARRVGQGVQAVLLGPDRCEPRHETTEVSPSTPGTDGRGRIRDAHDQEAHGSPAAEAVVLVDGHTDRDSRSRFRKGQASGREKPVTGAYVLEM